MSCHITLSLILPPLVTVSFTLNLIGIFFATKHSKDSFFYLVQDESNARFQLCRNQINEMQVSILSVADLLR